MGFLTGAQKDFPTMPEILTRLASIFARKNADYVTELRIEFINMTPCSQEHKLESAIIKWEELREELKATCRGNEQGSIEVLASLKLLISGLPRMKAMVDNAKLILDLKEVGFDRLLKLAKSCGKEWVRLKPKSNPKNPKPNPTPNPKHNPKDTPKNPTPSVGTVPSKDGVGGSNVMMGSNRVRRIRSHYRIAIIGVLNIGSVLIQRGHPRGV